MKFSRRDRPRRRAAEQRDELVPFPLIELHPIPQQVGTGHREDIESSKDQSAGMKTISRPPARGQGSSESGVGQKRKGSE